MGPPQQQVRPANRSSSSGGSTIGNASTVEQEKALRTQIHQDIERKAKVCANTLYECSLPRVDSYAYCFRHILQDPKAPYKQCGFFYSNGRRCLEPSPRYDAKKDYGTNYCFEHSRQTQLSKTKSTIGKLVPVQTTETLLHSLAHHVKLDKNKQHHIGNHTPLKITVHEDDDDNDVDVVTPSVDPFVDVDVAAINDSGRVVLDYASDSSSDGEGNRQPTYGSSWKGPDMDNSDNESVDSQGDDPLKHAGIYTAEEATRITREKLSRLQSLYMEQIHRLQHVLRERRRNFLKEQRAERETHCSIYDQIKETPRERKLYEELKGLNRYHRKHGVEAILQRKYLEKRAKATEGLQQKPPSLPKCCFTEGGVKCGERTLPCCKLCRKHVLEDKKQVLFRACGIEKSGVVCQEPLAGLLENVTCTLHVELPAQRSFNKRKYESESDGEVETGPIEAALPAGNNALAGEIDTSRAETNTATSGTITTDDDSGQEYKKNVKMSPKIQSKPTVKAESKRKSIKQEVTTSQRLRSTRAARAAVERQLRKQQQEQVDCVLDGQIKQEKEEHAAESEQPTEKDVKTAPAVDESGKLLNEEQLPVSTIPKVHANHEDGNDDRIETKLEPTQYDQEMTMDVSTSNEQVIEKPELNKQLKLDIEGTHNFIDRSTDLPEELKEVQNNVHEEKRDDGKVKVSEDEKNAKEILESAAEDEKDIKKEIDVVANEQTMENEKPQEQEIAKDRRDQEGKVHEAPEMSKRRRGAESRQQQKRDKNKDLAKGWEKEEPTKDDRSTAARPSTASDEEKGSKTKQPKSKPVAAEGGTSKVGEKLRRQQK